MARYCLAISNAIASLYRTLLPRYTDRGSVGVILAMASQRVEGRGQRVEGIDKRTNSSKHASLSYLSREAVTVHAR